MLVIGSCKDILNYFHFIILSRWFFLEKRHLFLLLLLQSKHLYFIALFYFILFFGDINMSFIIFFISGGFCYCFFLNRGMFASLLRHSLLPSQVSQVNRDTSVPSFLASLPSEVPEEFPALCSRVSSVTRFIHSISSVCTSIPVSQFTPLFCSFIFPCTHWAPDTLSCGAAGRQVGKQRSEKMGAILSPPVMAGNPGPQSVCGALRPSVIFWPFSLHSSPLPSPLIRTVLCPWLSPQPSRQAGCRYFQHLLGNDPFGDDYSHGPCGQQNREPGFLVPVNSWNAGVF